MLGEIWNESSAGATTSSMVLFTATSVLNDALAALSCACPQASMQAPNKQVELPAGREGAGKGGGREWIEPALCKQAAAIDSDSPW